MSDSESGNRSRDVQRMFDRIARRYDLINSLMTFGRDRVWRHCVLKNAVLPKQGRLLDVGTGTGGIASDAFRMDPSLSVVAADFSLEMMRTGRRIRKTDILSWCSSDALHLPFQDNTFDAVTSGYLIRNVTDPDLAFSEQRRVTKPGGRVVCLDTSPPPKNWLYPLVLVHFKAVIPFMGGMISGSKSAYRYLPDSTRSFKTPDKLAAIMRATGLTDVCYQRFMFGTIAIHVGTCP